MRDESHHHIPANENPDQVGDVMLSGPVTSSSICRGNASPTVLTRLHDHAPSLHTTTTLVEPVIYDQTSPNNSDGLVASSSIAPIGPLGLFQSAKFPEDMLYYHHLRDGSPNGLLSILCLNDIFKAEYLDQGFFHAALALSALNISQTNVMKALADKAALHALDHFVAALGTVRITDIDIHTPNSSSSCSPAAVSLTSDTQAGAKHITCQLATILFLALFELQRGQLKTWYVHSSAAVAFLSEHLEPVRASVIGESLIRSFSRLVTLLNIYDRTFSVSAAGPANDVATSLVNWLTISPLPSDRLLAILPRIIELEESWRSNPQFDPHWQEQAASLEVELEAWRCSLAPHDVPVPDFDEFMREEGDSVAASDAEDHDFISPIYLSKSSEPARAATNFMHYLVSLLRVQTNYSTCGKVLPPKADKVVILVCRLAAGVDHATCPNTHAYGHGLLPALMNAYYLSDNEKAKQWIRDWLDHFPKEREGIWNVKHARRLLAYVDGEYSRHGARAGWTIIKVRMVDLEDEGSPVDNKNDSDRESDEFSVEVYARSKLGWSIDFVQIP